MERAQHTKCFLLASDPVSFGRPLRWVPALVVAEAPLLGRDNWGKVET